MVEKIKAWLANVIEELIIEEKIPSIKKIDDTATDALINFNECNDKCDSIKTEFELLRDGVVSTVTRTQEIDEWFNGKEEKHG